MPMYNLIEYSDKYSQTSGSLGQYYRDEPYLDCNGIADFLLIIITVFRKTKIAGRIGNGSTKDVKIMVSLKYLSNFWSTFKLPLNDCEINIILIQSASCFIVYALIANQAPTFAITDTKLYVPVVIV